jgi:hypothetical protein
MNLKSLQASVVQFNRTEGTDYEYGVRVANNVIDMDGAIVPLVWDVKPCPSFGAINHVVRL